MIRTLGVLCGAAIAIALLTWLVGVPQFTSERETADAPLAVVPLRENVLATAVSSESAVDDTAEPNWDKAEPPSDAAAERIVVESSDSGETEAPIETLEAESMTPTEPLSDPRWFAFWTPFRSEIAANGFVGRLQSVTGLDYRVVKVKPGVYEVAFAYRDDLEIDSNLSTISAATGLDLPGAR